VGQTGLLAGMPPGRSWLTAYSTTGTGNICAGQATGTTFLLSGRQGDMPVQRDLLH